MILLFIFIIGLAVGSFLNVLIDRLPNNESIMGRSHCDHCRKNLRPLSLIPVLSYLLQKGRCSFCRGRLSLQYPAIELITGALFIVTWISFVGFGIEVASYYLIVVSILTTMFFSDLKFQIIPDELQLAFFLVSLRLLYVLNNPDLLGYLERFSFAFVVMLPLLFLFLITKGRGMGFADIKLTFIIGFLLGLKIGFLIIYLSFITGGLIGFILLILGAKNRKSKIAFGPFIIVSTLAVLYNQAFFSSLINSFL